MKKARNLSIIILLLLLVGCATFDSNTYKALETARVTYTQSMGAAGALWMQGKITEAQKNEIIKIGNIYYSSYGIARSAYEVYHANPTPAGQEGLTKVLNDCLAKLGDVVAYVTRLQGGVK
jgi:hypothetical protein